MLTSSKKYGILYEPLKHSSKQKRGSIAQLGEHLPYKQRVTGSSPFRVANFASVAQLVEQRTENPRVIGSIPIGGTIFYADVAHLVERHLAKVEVASSSLVIRSI